MRSDFGFIIGIRKQRTRPASFLFLRGAKYGEPNRLSLLMTQSMFVKTSVTHFPEPLNARNARALVVGSSFSACFSRLVFYSPMLAKHAAFSVGRSKQRRYFVFANMLSALSTPFYGSRAGQEWHEKKCYFAVPYASHLFSTGRFAVSHAERSRPATPSARERALS